MAPREFSSFVAIDPLALIFSTEVYLILMEIKNPHVALTATLAQLAKQTPVAERKAVLARLHALQANFSAVQEAFEKAE